MRIVVSDFISLDGVVQALGGGKRLFPDDGSARGLELVSATTTATGVLICTYRPAGR
jgi:hypothetical protein